MELQTVESRVNDFLNNASDSLWTSSRNEKLFEHISVGRQSSDHPVFNTITGLHKDHLHPRDFINGGGNASIVSFVFHFNKNIVRDNSRELNHPSYLWYEIRHKFDGIIPLFVSFIEEIYAPSEIIVPSRTGKYSVVFRDGTLVSNWSERHIAYACGLGSFGLHSALITGRGCTHRLLSIIVNRACPPTDINEKDIHFNCLYFANGTCGSCAEKCPVGAIHDGIHDLTKCYAHENITNKIKSVEIFGHEVAACGLCMCGVPCDTSKP